jgi:hypothetical protein
MAMFAVLWSRVPDIDKQEKNMGGTREKMKARERKEWQTVEISAKHKEYQVGPGPLYISE